MRPNDSSSDSCYTAHKHDSTPPVLLHCGDTQLCEEIRGAAVDAPCFLKRLDRDVRCGLYASLAACGSGVVDEDCRRTKSGCYGGVKGVDLELYQ
jgi:hypothetical protein